MEPPHAFIVRFKSSSTTRPAQNMFLEKLDFVTFFISLSSWASLMVYVSMWRWVCEGGAGGGGVCGDGFVAMGV